MTLRGGRRISEPPDTSRTKLDTKNIKHELITKLITRMEVNLRDAINAIKSK